jgi:UDP-N-acetylmuramate dehydrogenase
MISDQVKQQLQQTLSNEVFFNEPLSRLTTMRIGGPADAIVYPVTIEEAQAVLKIAHENKVPLFILGWGSNLLVRDGGMRGIVLNLGRGFQKIEITGTEGNEVKLEVEAGVKIPALLDFLVEHGLSGLEFMAGIPATLGGAIWMNAGTRDGEIGQTIKEVTLVTKQGNIKKMERKDCGFSYRSNKFPAGSVILETSLLLKRDDTTAIKSRIEKNKKHRIETQPLNLPNLGSVFKNPGKKKYAGKLIEEAGLKGVRIGQTRISEKHGNFIVNEGDAKARDVIALIGLVKDKVKEKFNVRLETEVRIIGEKADDEE